MGMLHIQTIMRYLNSERNKIFVLVCGIVLLVLFIYGFHTIEKSYDTAASPKNIEIQKGDSQALKTYLNEMRESRAPWISRKEIAAWSTIILYLSIILFLFKKIKLILKRPIISFFFLLIFSIFVGLFIHQQYGQMVSSMATQRAFYKYFYLVSMNDSSLNSMDFNMNSNQPIPKFISKEIRQQQEMLRQFGILQRMLLPFYKPYSWILCKDDSIQTVEVEEGIIYDIIILALVFFLFNIFVGKKKSEK
jgi:hypothetical protein